MLPDGRGQIFEGKLEDYKRQAKLSGFPDVLEPVAVNPGDQRTSESSNPTTNNLDSAVGEKISEQEVMNLKREAQRLQKRLAILDSEISKLTAAISECDRRLEVAHSDFQLAATIASEKTLSVSQLENSEIEWLELSESVESIKSKLTQMGRSF
jgi:predicted RNase H-like nuclease (RuvC/YqgF family)